MLVDGLPFARSGPGRVVECYTFQQALAALTREQDTCILDTVADRTEGDSDAA